MNKKGFTLVELLATIVIIAILAGLAVLGIITLINRAKEKYYISLEKNVALAGQEYFIDNKSEQPRFLYNAAIVKINSETNLNDTKGNIVIGNDVLFNSDKDLDDNYLTNNVKDYNGNVCEGYVRSFLTDDNRYEYTTCLVCEEYKTENSECNAIYNEYTLVSQDLNLVSGITLTKEKLAQYVTDQNYVYVKINDKILNNPDISVGFNVKNNLTTSATAQNVQYSFMTPREEIIKKDNTITGIPLNITLKTSDNKTYNGTSWTNKNVIASFSYNNLTDNNISFLVDGDTGSTKTESTDGQDTKTVQVQTEYGINENAGSYSYKIDKTNPTISISYPTQTDSEITREVVFEDNISGMTGNYTDSDTEKTFECASSNCKKKTITTKFKEAASGKLKVCDKAGNCSAETEYNIAKYTITFDKNGSETTTTIKSCMTVTGSCSITSPTVKAESGKTAVGWNTSKTATTSTWNSNTSKSVSANATYYAITKSNCVLTSVTIDDNSTYVGNWTSQAKAKITANFSGGSCLEKIEYGFSTSSTSTSVSNSTTSNNKDVSSKCGNIENTCYLYVKATDTSGNTKDERISFKVDSIAPTIAWKTNEAKNYYACGSGSLFAKYKIYDNGSGVSSRTQIFNTEAEYSTNYVGCDSNCTVNGNEWHIWSVATCEKNLTGNCWYNSGSPSNYKLYLTAKDMVGNETQFVSTNTRTAGTSNNKTCESSY